MFVAWTLFRQIWGNSSKISFVPPKNSLLHLCIKKNCENNRANCPRCAINPLIWPVNTVRLPMLIHNQIQSIVTSAFGFPARLPGGNESFWQQSNVCFKFKDPLSLGYRQRDNQQKPYTHKNLQISYFIYRLVLKQWLHNSTPLGNIVVLHPHYDLLAIVSRTWDLVCINLSFASRDFVCARSTASAQCFDHALHSVLSIGVDTTLSVSRVSGIASARTTLAVSAVAPS